MYIPDPVELMEGRIEREMDKIDADGTYPCAGDCEKRYPVDEMICVSVVGDGPLVCGLPGCISEDIGRQFEKAVGG